MSSKTSAELDRLRHAAKQCIALTLSPEEVHRLYLWSVQLQEELKMARRLIAMLGLSARAGEGCDETPIERTLREAGALAEAF